MSQSVEDIWQSHSMKFLEMAFRVDRQESLHEADGCGKSASECGDSIEFFLIITDDRIQTISYALQGCINTNACANAVIELIEGKTLAEAWALKPGQVFDYLESLDDHHFHCAELSIEALNAALADAREKSRAPWKKMYRRR